jgi:hypothetical protein
MKNKYIKLTISIFLILTLVIFLFQLFKTKEFFEENNDKNMIPKKIWTFWNGEIPNVVNKCINTWKKYNPEYKITLLNKENLSQYLPELDISNMKNIDSDARLSDIIRLNILAKEGGIWSDASIICLQPFDWINDLHNKEDSEFVGYYIDSFTIPQYKDKSPVIESWFFACVPQSKFVCDWRDEFSKITKFNSINDYLNDLKSQSVNFQNIAMPNYLTIHISAQKVLQGNKKYKLSLVKAEDDAFKYLTQNGWDSKKAIKNLVDCTNEPIKSNSSCSFLQGKIIKLRGDERKEIDSIDTPLDFFNKI